MPKENGSVGEQLRQYIEKIERLQEERKALGGDIREVFSGAKGAGFEPKVMRQVIKKRKMNKAALQEQEALEETYRHALGME